MAGDKTVQSVFYDILRLYQRVGGLLDESLSAEGLTASQYAVMGLLRRHEPTSSADLARRFGITAQSMGAFVRMLEAKGMIERSGAPDNKRIVLVRRSAEGKATQQRCDRLVGAAEAAFLKGVDPARLAPFQLMVRELAGLGPDDSYD